MSDPNPPRPAERMGAREQLRRLAETFQPPIPPPLLAGSPDARPASVLLLFSPVPHVAARSADGLRASDLNVLLQVRARTLREHAGQVSFPGGRREKRDADAVQTALREAQEETGIDPSGVEVLAELPPVPLAVSNHSVTPVVGWWPFPGPLTAVDQAETTRVWQVEVAQLLDPASRFMSVFRRGSATFRSPAFDVDGIIVWGFTAMLLDRVFDDAGWAIPWDATRDRDIVP